MARLDYAFPFRIDASSRQAAQSAYPQHVGEMIRQLLLTTPGERADLPEFGCGLRQLLFAPHSEAIDATAQILVLESLTRWLAGVIEVVAVRVLPVEETGDEAQLVFRIDYLLLPDATAQTTEVRIGT
jgi:phage baseplate assembly protein W